VTAAAREPIPLFPQGCWPAFDGRQVLRFSPDPLGAGITTAWKITRTSFAPRQEIPLLKSRRDLSRC